jgi:hypothetical protein
MKQATIHRKCEAAPSIGTRFKLTEEGRLESWEASLVGGGVAQMIDGGSRPYGRVNVRRGGTGSGTIGQRNFPIAVAKLSQNLLRPSS